MPAAKLVSSSIRAPQLRRPSVVIASGDRWRLCASMPTLLPSFSLVTALMGYISSKGRITLECDTDFEMVLRDDRRQSERQRHLDRVRYLPAFTYRFRS